MAVIGTIIHFLPDENYRRPSDEEIISEVVPLGRKFALALLFGNKHKMKKLSRESLIEKVEKSNIRNYYLEISTSLYIRNNVAMWWAIHDKLEYLKYFRALGYPLDIETFSEYSYFIQVVEPFLQILDEDVKKKMKLIKLENKDDSVTMTFAYAIDVDGDGYYNIIELPEKGKMMFTVTFEYLPVDGDNFIQKLIRKISNIPLLSLILGKWGTSYRWLCADYKYNYNLYDYYEWVVDHFNNSSDASGKKIKEDVE